MYKRQGLIGANGAGKSTFLKILSGQLEPTSGEVIITPGQRLSFLQQDHFKYDEYTVLDTVIMGNKRLYDIMKEKDAIYMKEDFTDEDGIRASELEAEFADMDGWNAESDAATMLNGLGIPTEDHYTLMADMPSALKVKVLLAQEMCIRDRHGAVRCGRRSTDTPGGSRDTGSQSTGSIGGSRGTGGGREQACDGRDDDRCREPLEYHIDAGGDRFVGKNRLAGIAGRADRRAGSRGRGSF